jgi:hypothetical protein
MRNKIPFFSGIVLVSLLSGVAYGSALPMVQCEMVTSSIAANGSSSSIHGETLLTLHANKSNSVTAHGFELFGRLKQICAADGGPCSTSQTLKLTIKSGKSESMMVVTVPADASTERWSTALTVGTNQAFVNCDVVPQ